MKRYALGVWIMALLLGLGILGSWAVNRNLNPISQSLEQAAELALSGDWDRALEIPVQAQKAWEETWTLHAALCSHEPLEEVDEQFAQLEVYARSRDPVLYAATCIQISQQLHAIAEGQTLSLRNLL